IQQTLDRIAPRKYRLLRGRGELYKIESILTGKPVLKDGTLQSLIPGILGPSSPSKLEKNLISILSICV
ncbi:MAG: hypothetical protein V3S72_10685, partial [Desulfobacterales bacterium]